MAVASCIWLKAQMKGAAPSKRQGHAVCVKGNTIYLFGGSCYSKVDEEFNNEFYKLQVDGSKATWFEMPQQGDVPSERDEHALCSIGNKLYLYGGKDNLVADQCLTDVYEYDLGACCWQRHYSVGYPPQTLGFSLSVVDDNVYVFGGICLSEATNEMYLLHVDSMEWTPLQPSGFRPEPRCNHAAAVVSQMIYVYGGSGGDNCWFANIYAFDTNTLFWSEIMTNSNPPLPRGGHTFTAHHEKDIYVFGGHNDSYDYNTFSDLHKFSLARQKWKQPVYIGELPEARSSHAACIIHSHLYVIGGMGEDQEFTDVHVLKLINPSDRISVEELKAVLLHAADIDNSTDNAISQVSFTNMNQAKNDFGTGTSYTESCELVEVSGFPITQQYEKRTEVITEWIQIGETLIARHIPCDRIQLEEYLQELKGFMTTMGKIYTEFQPMSESVMQGHNDGATEMQPAVNQRELFTSVKLEVTERIEHLQSILPDIETLQVNTNCVKPWILHEDTDEKIEEKHIEENMNDNDECDENSSSDEFQSNGSHKLTQHYSQMHAKQEEELQQLLASQRQMSEDWLRSKQDELKVEREAIHKQQKLLNAEKMQISIEKGHLKQRSRELQEVLNQVQDL